MTVLQYIFSFVFFCETLNKMDESTVALIITLRVKQYLAITEWGWVGYEEFCISRRVLSTEADGRGG